MMAQNGRGNHRRAERTAEPAMPIPPLVPKGEALRRAVAWLADHETWTPHLVEEACQRFDLGPADEDFLLQELRRFHAPPGSGS
jgi:hypothetical protein